MNNYDKEWMEQRIYTIDRTLDLEGDAISSKTYKKYVEEKLDLKKKLQKMETLDAGSEELDNDPVKVIIAKILELRDSEDALMRINGALVDLINEGRNARKEWQRIKTKEKSKYLKTLFKQGKRKGTVDMSDCKDHYGAYAGIHSCYVLKINTVNAKVQIRKPFGNKGNRGEPVWMESNLANKEIIQVPVEWLTINEYPNDI